MYTLTSRLFYLLYILAIAVCTYTTIIFFRMSRDLTALQHTADYFTVITMAMFTTTISALATIYFSTVLIQEFIIACKGSKEKYVTMGEPGEDKMPRDNSGNSAEVYYSATYWGDSPHFS